MSYEPIKTRHPIFVPTREANPPAVLAMVMEGLVVTESRMRHPTHYAETFYAQWLSGNGFIVVEEDVVPWPGAVLEIDRCPYEWCCFEYPNGLVYEVPRSGYCNTLGCVKFSSSLIARNPAPIDVWQHRDYHELDGAVIAHLKDEYRHEHEPPVAHVKLMTTTQHREAMPLGDKPR